MEQDISLLGALAGSILSFALGGFWYSKAGFGERWALLAGLSDESLQSANRGRMVVTSFAITLISALVLAAFLGESGLGLSTAAGFAVGFFWVAASFGVNYVFEQRSLRLWLINGGYHTVQFTLIGFSIGLANQLT